MACLHTLRPASYVPRARLISHYIGGLSGGQSMAGHSSVLWKWKRLETGIGALQRRVFTQSLVAKGAGGYARSCCLLRRCVTMSRIAGTSGGVICVFTGDAATNPALSLRCHLNFDEAAGPVIDQMGLVASQILGVGHVRRAAEKGRELTHGADVADPHAAYIGTQRSTAAYIGIARRARRSAMPPSLDISSVRDLLTRERL